MIIFAVHGYEGANPALEFGPLQAAFEQRAFPCRPAPSSVCGYAPWLGTTSVRRCRAQCCRIAGSL